MDRDARRSREDAGRGTLEASRSVRPAGRTGPARAMAWATVVAAVVGGGAFLLPTDAEAQNRPIGVLYPQAVDNAPPPAPEREAPCTEDCFLLSKLVLRGSVTGGLSFELHGVVRAHEEQKIPLFGPPGQVRVDDVTIDGSPAQIGFAGEHFHVFTRARTFVIRGRLSLGSDQLLSIPGPIVSVETGLTNGRIIEGEHLAGVANSVLHFESEDGEAEKHKVRVPTIFRLSRSIRIGRESGFVYRLVTSQALDIGAVRLPLRYGEKVADVQGGAGAFSIEGSELVVPVSGHEAELTISGTLENKTGARSYQPDARSAYEWWLVESDPEHRIATGGEPKLVETSQSPIPPTMPGARVFLVQKGQALEVDARSLVRGDVLAAVVRNHKRFVAITGRGEAISDEQITYDNNGLDHLMVTPSGKPMYLSTDGNAQRILHTEAGARDVLVPVSTGKHSLRVQSLAELPLWSLAGVLTVPPTTYPLATSTAETTVGLPAHVKPIAVLGGDRTRWGFGRADLVAIVVAGLVAGFGFRTRKTRIVGALATAGLWFVSRDGFIVVASILGTLSLVFVASRFLRGTKLTLASAVLVALGLLVGRSMMTETPSFESASADAFEVRPDVPQPDVGGAPAKSGDPSAVTPVSLSMPTSEHYVTTSRQLVTNERPFVPRIVFVTTTLTAALHVVWFAIALLLVWAHKDALLLLRDRIKERLLRRPDPATPTQPEAPPF